MSKPKTYTSSAIKLIVGTLCLLSSLSSAAQAQEAKPSPTPTPAQAAPKTTETPPVRVAIQLTATYGKDKVARKHFYLLNKPLTAQKLEALQANPKVGNMPSLQDYQQKTRASEAFIKNWLEKYRCETVYCRDITADDIKLIPEFDAAYKNAQKVFGDKRDADNHELALKWLVNFLPQEIRTGYYDLRMKWVREAVKIISSEGTIVRIASTNRRGEAYFTDVDPAGGDEKTGQAEDIGSKYYISNLIPIETGDDCYLWITSNKVTGKFPKTAFNLGEKQRIKVAELKGATPLSFQCKAASGTPGK